MIAGKANKGSRAETVYQKRPKEALDNDYMSTLYAGMKKKTKGKKASANTPAPERHDSAKSFWDDLPNLTFAEVAALSIKNPGRPVSKTNTLSCKSTNANFAEDFPPLEAVKSKPGTCGKEERVAAKGRTWAQAAATSKKATPMRREPAIPKAEPTKQPFAGGLSVKTGPSSQASVKTLSTPTGGSDPFPALASRTRKQAKEIIEREGPAAQKKSWAAMAAELKAAPSSPIVDSGAKKGDKKTASPPNLADLGDFPKLAPSSTTGIRRGGKAAKKGKGVMARSQVVSIGARTLNVLYLK
ncbi:hypothetical protein HDU96_000803 [Phlyctochytrium bullatum]|nr:hypothetical protein HDU96_000803 [Phlyctochytrium bullatum]